MTETTSRPSEVEEPAKMDTQEKKSNRKRKPAAKSGPKSGSRANAGKTKRSKKDSTAKDSTAKDSTAKDSTAKDTPKPKNTRRGKKNNTENNKTETKGDDAKNPRAAAKSKGKKSSNAENNDAKESKTRSKSDASGKKKKSKKKLAYKEPRCEKVGLNLPVCRIDNIMRNIVINPDEHYALKMIRAAEGGEVSLPYDKKKVDKMQKEGFSVVQDADSKTDGKRFFKNVEPTPLDKVDDDRLARVLDRSYEKALHAKKLDFAKKKLSALKKTGKGDKENKADEKAAALYKEFKSKLAKAKNAQQEQDPNSTVDEVEFYLGLDKTFFDDFEDEPYKDEYTHAKDCVKKEKLQVSKYVKMYFTAFVELVVQQMTVNALHNALEANKKVLHPSDATSKVNKDLFPLHGVLDVLKVHVPDNPKKDGVQEEDHSAETGVGFSSHVLDCVRSAKKLISQNIEDPVHEISVSKSYRTMCEKVINTLTVRVSQMMSSLTGYKSKKNIKTSDLITVLRQLHNLLDADYDKSYAALRSKAIACIEATKNSVKRPGPYRGRRKVSLKKDSEAPKDNTPLSKDTDGGVNGDVNEGVNEDTNEDTNEDANDSEEEYDEE